MLSVFASPAVKYLKKAAAKESKNSFEAILCHLGALYRQRRALFRSSGNTLLSKAYLRYRNIERAATGTRLSFISFHELVALTNDWVRSLPETYDLVVGIPRSGLLVANMIASKLGKPLTTPDRLDQEQIWMTRRSPRPHSRLTKVLLVDDKVSKGRQLKSAIALLKQHNEFRITTASLLVTPDGANLVDLYHKIVSDPIIFEWNLVHAKIGTLATDLDGVICYDPPKNLDRDESAYLEWMRNAKPYLVPLYEVDAIISSRLERYRAETEDWLSRHRVSYKKLILWDLPSLEERHGKFAKYKAEALLRVKPDLYWESNLNEAREIHRSTGIPTLCVDRMVLFS